MSDANICGLLVHVRPGEEQRMTTRLADMPGTEVHATTDDGRLVITVEDTEAARCFESITGVANLEGVLATSLVYHHCDNSTSKLETA